MKIIGHRGCIYEVENTLNSFEKAFELGADGIELDTQSTLDGTIVVSHDENLKRLVGYDFNIREHTFLELSNININGNPIPTLTSILEIAKSKNKIVDIELKNPKDLEKVASIVRSFNFDLFFISSFYHDAMFEGKKTFNNLKFAYLYSHKPKDVLQYAKEVDFLKPNIGYLTEDYKTLSSITIPWTVNEAKEFELAKSIGVYAIITDVVDTMRNLENKVVNEQNIYITYLKSMIVKNESSLTEGSLTIFNKIANLRIEGIFLNDKLVDIGKSYPFIFSVGEKLTINIPRVENSSVLTIITKEIGRVSVKVAELFNAN